jgi:hypothetical protein
VVVAGGGAALDVSAGTEPLGRRFRRRREPQAVCPVDDWAFTPRDTDGRCPLCGWEAPPGGEPAGHRGDWFWAGMGILLAVSVAMGVLVVLTYLRS